MTASVCRPAMTRSTTSSCTPRKWSKPKVVLRIWSTLLTAALLMSELDLSKLFGGLRRFLDHPLGGLAVPEVCVQTAPLKQLLVRAELRNPAVLQHGDAVGANHRGQAVGNDDRGAVAGDALQRFLDRLLGAAVECARRLVKHEDRRVLEQRPRNCDPLLLAAGKLEAALADHRVIAVR